MVAATPATFASLGITADLLAVLTRTGIETPTPIQEQAIPALLAGRDILGQARTGSGKTLAFALPLATRCAPQPRNVQGLVLVPTRELAIQVAEVLTPLAEARKLTVTLLYGGRSDAAEKRALAAGVHIVVGTPGRTLDHLQQGTLSLANVQLAVLDEADEMLDRGFGPSVERILARTNPKRQMALLSATQPEWVTKTAAKHLHNPLTVQVVSQQPPPDIEHTLFDMDPGMKLDALRTLLNRQGPDPIIVFGRTKHGVKKLALQLQKMGYSVAALQGNMSQNARERVMTDFRAGAVRVLLATNVAARGLDIAGVELVVNYELPESAELLTHRVGRTGRMGLKGTAMTFLTPEDHDKWRQMEKALGRRLPRLKWTEPAPPRPVLVETPPAPATATAPTKPEAAKTTLSLLRREPAPAKGAQRGSAPHGGATAKQAPAAPGANSRSGNAQPRGGQGMVPAAQPAMATAARTTPAAQPGAPATTDEAATGAPRRRRRWGRRKPSGAGNTNS